MNAAPPVLSAQPLSEPAQADAQTSAPTATARAGSQDFAAALSDAGGKPARKSTVGKQHDPASGGTALPVSGIQPPPVPAVLPPAKANIPAAASPGVAGVAGASEPATAAAAGPLTNTGSIAPAPPGNAPATAPGAIPAAAATGSGTSATTTNLVTANLGGPGAMPAAAPPGIASSPGVANSAGIANPPGIAAPSDVADPSEIAAAPAAAQVDAATAPSSGLNMPRVVGPATTAISAAPAAAAVASLPVGKPATAKANDVSADSGPSASASAAPPPSADAGTLNDSTLTSGTATGGADSAAQSIMAAAIAQGTSNPAPDMSSYDDLATPDTGVSQGAANPGDAAAGAPAAALARASAAAISAVTAATAAAVTSALSESAGVDAGDKRSHGGGDATLAGVSNDGSAGAAQLLTSNISTDSAPMPTFKVAAGVDTAQFGQGVADRVALMMDGNLTSAKLQVNPPALGPIEVRIALQGGHAQVSLSSHSALTRDALESSSSKLREMLGSQGFSQVSVDISQRSFQERSPPSQAYEAAPAIGDAAAPIHAPLPVSRSASGLLDAYA